MPQNFEVWSEHWDVLVMFLRVQTQWRATSSGVVGLDYGVVLQLASLQQIADPVALLDDLQIMESRAVELIAKATKPKAEVPRRKR